MNNFIHLENSIAFSDRVLVESVIETESAYLCTIKNEVKDISKHNIIVGDILRCERINNASFLCIVATVNDNIISINKNTLKGKGRPYFGDYFIRFGNTTSSKRSGVLSLEQYGESVASLMVYDNVNTTDLSNKVTVKIGYLDGIYDEDLGLISGYGAYIKNGYISGKIYATEGSNIYTKEEIKTILSNVNIQVDDSSKFSINDWVKQKYNGEAYVFYKGSIYFLPKGSTTTKDEEPTFSPKWLKKTNTEAQSGLTELLRNLNLTNNYLTAYGSKIWSGNSDKWNGLSSADYINQPIRTYDNVKFANLDVSYRITSKDIYSETLNASVSVTTERVNSTDVYANSSVNTHILNSNVTNAVISVNTKTVNSDIVNADTEVNTNVVNATTLVETNLVKANTVRSEEISSNFFMSGFTGTGYRLAKDENENFLLEIDRLTVRKDFTVYELIVSQIRATNGSLWVSDGIKIESAVLENGYYVCTIDSDGQTIYVPFVMNDIVRCQRFNGQNMKYYTAKVIAVDYNEGNFTLQIIEGASIPEAKDEIVRMGNTTDRTRQGAIYLTSSDNGAPYIDVIDNVTSASLANKTKVRMGKLNGIVDPDLGALSGYGLYADSAYIKGKLIVQAGSNVYTKDESKEQIDEVKNSLTPFITITGDQVFTYRNLITVDKETITYQAVEHNFVGEPIDRKWEYINLSGQWVEITNTFNTLVYTLRHDSAIWEGRDSVSIRYRVEEKYDQITVFKIYDGEGGLTVVITSDYGDLFINGNINTILRANVYWGGDNITNTLNDSAFEWFRKSSYGENDDNIWNNENKYKKNVEIFSDDVYKKAIFECEVTVDL